MAKKSKPTTLKLDRSWEISDAMRTLQRAEEIKKDKFLMGGIKKSLSSLSTIVKPGKSKK